ncbi:unnamed protein product [Ilex paraguariensis]|uniref:FAR1 domain-containing protein n=1 Tax=Ilex paraguariensis TaxID=185542 RepID=A0ABC8UMC5_9AQUA
MPKLLLGQISTCNARIAVGVDEEISSGSISVESNKEKNEDEMEETRNRDDKIKQPTIGMLFDTIDEIVEYYMTYGKEMSFPVSKRTSLKGDDGEIKYVTVACSHNGKSLSKNRSMRPIQPEKTPLFK